MISFLFGMLFGALALWAYLERREYMEGNATNKDDDDDDVDNLGV